MHALAARWFTRLLLLPPYISMPFRSHCSARMYTILRPSIYNISAYLARPVASPLLRLLAMLRRMTDFMIDVHIRALDVRQRLELILEILRYIVCLP